MRVGKIIKKRQLRILKGHSLPYTIHGTVRGFDIGERSMKKRLESGNCDETVKESDYSTLKIQSISPEILYVRRDYIYSHAKLEWLMFLNNRGELMVYGLSDSI